MLNIQDTINQHVWTTPGALRELDYNTTFTDPGEQAAFELVKEQVAGKPILDIGVGTGRTIGILKSLTHDYRAIDYLQSMVDVSRKRHPDATIELGDARMLTGMPEDHFGFVQFSYNGIDSLTTEDRVLVITSVRRVLRDQGLFLFSTLNLDGPIPHERPWNMWLPAPSDPLRFTVRLARGLFWKPLEVVRWYKLQKYCSTGQGFLVAPLPAHHWGILAHYTTLTRQLDELNRSGFSVVRVFGNVVGAVVEPGEDTSGISWFHIVSRKNSAQSALRA